MNEIFKFAISSIFFFSLLALIVAIVLIRSGKKNDLFLMLYQNSDKVKFNKSELIFLIFSAIGLLQASCGAVWVGLFWINSDYRMGISIILGLFIFIELAQILERYSILRADEFISSYILSIYERKLRQNRPINKVWLADAIHEVSKITSVTESNFEDPRYKYSFAFKLAVAKDFHIKLLENQIQLLNMPNGKPTNE